MAIRKGKCKCMICKYVRKELSAKTFKNYLVKDLKEMKQQIVHINYDIMGHEEMLAELYREKKI